MNKKILILLLILGAVLISGCVEEQVVKPEQIVQPRQEDKIIIPTETGYDQGWNESGNARMYVNRGHILT